MSPFLGNHQNRLDAKGRVSVPAPFRALLRDGQGSVGLVFRRSLKHACVEAWPVPAFEALVGTLQNLDPFSDEYEDFVVALHGDAFPADPDKEGRVLLPETLVRHAQVTDSVMFIGAGKSFQIWEPVAGAQRLAGAREVAKTLPSRGVAAAAGA